ncbi:hypothetical protein AS850_11040 [Frondihabitans sp. 762G35]|uniref:bleomycin resistance protein n=1 Tax=Frondihabitans sp. 762G35 TaxID=1446794 RepID=UPI000D2149F9|nr:VOC family protein [Frondihabitans sp. 762G35]ARC57606.1 hypothetical protein AS850_11040 [Frondihabitans sp. 762G35]
MTTDLDPALVPELLVSDLDQSLEFWVGHCGFSVSYSRRDEGFAFVACGTAHVMLEEIGAGRNWISGPLERPLGRGVNFQISVSDCASLAASLEARSIPLFMQLETKWYRIGDQEAGVEQFVVSDPDGYLLRFQSSLGRRSAK